MTDAPTLDIDGTGGISHPFVTTFHEKPYRHYQVHVGQTDTATALAAKKGVRVASVTQVIGKTVDKAGALKGWAQRETVNALDALNAQYGDDAGIFTDPERLEAAIIAAGQEVNATAFCELFTSQQSTLPWGRPSDLLRLVKQSEESMNAKMKAAADRGLAIHDALETYANTGDPASLNPEKFPEAYRGYIRAVAAWIVQYRPRFKGAEVVVGSLKHRYGGRLDFHLEVVGNGTDSYGQRIDGRGLIDLKTNNRGQVYPVEHFTQAEAYEVAAVESGYEPTDYRAVLAVGPGGTFDFRRSSIRPDAFLKALAWFREQKWIEDEAKKVRR